MKKTLGIVRNRTIAFNDLRREKKSTQTFEHMSQANRFSKERLGGVKPQIEMVAMDSPYAMKKPFIDDMSTVNTIQTPKPAWTVYFDECQIVLRGVEQLRREMLTYQNKRLTCIKVSEEKGYEMKIYECAKDATSRIKKCQKLLEAMKGQANNEPPAHAKVCTTASFRLANDIQQATKQLRLQQRSFVEQRKQFQVTEKASFLDLAVEDALNMGNGFEQDLIEDEAMRDLEERNEQIKNIVQSIYQLNDIYKEVHSLVAIQGSLLDRIDANIEASQVAVQNGLQHLQKANHRQKKTSRCACRMMIVLLIANAIVFIILCKKWF